MTEGTTKVCLDLLKADLGISHNKRDEYFTSLLTANEEELASKGIKLDEDRTSDVVLLAEYTAFNYRNRDTENEMPKNLALRIKNRKMKARCEYDG